MERYMVVTSEQYYSVLSSIELCLSSNAKIFVFFQIFGISCFVSFSTMNAFHMYEKMLHTMINSTFRLSFCAKTFCMTTIYILFRADREVTPPWSGGWICTVSIKTGHCALCSCDLHEWQVASMRFVLSQAHLYKHRIELTFTLGKKGSCMRWLLFEMMGKP